MTEERIEESLAPIPEDKRTLTHRRFTLSWASDLIAIYSFMMGSGAIAAGLNIFQAIVAMLIGLSISIVFYALNGMPGAKLGIPMIVQMRPCFGNRSSKFTGVVRAIPAIAWYGFESWLGAVALNLFSMIVLGYNNVWVWFVVFQIAQIIISGLGIRKIFQFTSYAALILFGLIIAMTWYIISQFGFSLSEELTKPGSWGVPFVFTITAFVSMAITCIVNASDYTRNIKNASTGKLAVAWTLGLIPPMAVLSILGMICYSVTGVWSPIDLFVKYVPALPLVLVAMIFIILGQFSTNMFANIIPPNFVWRDILKIPWWSASVITGAIGFLIIPWYLTTGAGFYMFMNFYGALLGPLVGVMVVDWLFIRKKQYNMKGLYEGNQYRYWKGINPAGIIAFAVGSMVGLLNLTISSISGLVAGGIIYWILSKYWINKKYPTEEGNR